MKNNTKHQLSKTVIAISLAAMILTALYSPVFAQENTLNLFSGEQRFQGTETREGLPAYITRQRTAVLNPEALTMFNNFRATSGQLHLNLFSDLAFDSQIISSEATPTGGRLLKGLISGSSYSEVTLVYQDNALSGGVAFNDQYYKIMTDENGTLTISQINQQGYPQDLAPIEPAIDLAGVSAETSNPEQQDSANEIDVMVVYTAQARLAVGGTSAMQNLINLAMSETNTGFANSQVNHRFILVHTAEFNYPEADYYTMLSDLQDANGDALDPVHALRNNYSADLVIMLVANTQYCGLAYLMSNPDVGFSSYAFSVVSINCASGYYSFAHEAGHNMGSQHNRENASQQGAFNYSYGFYNQGASFRTIMAYNCPGGCTRVNHWSNPNITYNGLPTGVSESNPAAAFNSLSLNQTAAFVANFKTRPFDAPTDFIYLSLTVK